MRLLVTIVLLAGALAFHTSLLTSTRRSVTDERHIGLMRKTPQGAATSKASEAVLDMREKTSWGDTRAEEPSQSGPPTRRRNGIVIVAGFEQFNILLYRKAAEKVMQTATDVPISVFTDQDIAENAAEVQAALDGAQILFCSLIFDFKQVQWLLDRIDNVPTRFCFESSLELMSETRVNAFEMKGGGGAPAPVKALLKQFGSDKEEDKLQGYLKFLKIGPKLLKWVPVTEGKVADLRNWLTVYAYWTEGGLDNVVNMLFRIIQEPTLGIISKATTELSSTEAVVNEQIPTISSSGSSSSSKGKVELSKSIIEYPAIGLYHPLRAAAADKDPSGETSAYFETPAEYEKWYLRTHPYVSADAPRVAVLLYRKHVLTEQAYIPNLITLMETEGVIPFPIFINGVEAHTVVRDLFTTPYEPSAQAPSRSKAASVDAIVNTIGFPLVGGPAGSMEGGRGIELAKEILTSKNVPYFVAAPLLIQDTDSWTKNGVQGLQQVVLYSLPELDGAVEAVVLGGLVGGDSITIQPERVRKLLSRLKSKVGLRKKAAFERDLAFVCYGFPPNVGAVGTAALLNVERSLENVLLALHNDGYDVGTVIAATSSSSSSSGGGSKRLGGGHMDGADLVAALKLLARDDVTAGGVPRAQAKLEEAGFKGVQVVGKAVSHTELKSWLGKKMAGKMEAQWGDLSSYGDIACAGAGKFSVLGLQLGKVFIGVQPVLGIEGDPMRMLFERDLTPHPQYASFYKWLSEERAPDTYIHFGMHGTVEWLPGSPLGNTADSWSDVLLGSATNVYLYACNNPSESILAKRRGYATVVSHNVPPYARAGLYKELLSLKEALAEYQMEQLSVAQAQAEEGGVDAAAALLSPLSIVASLVRKAGLERDLPFPAPSFLASSSSSFASSEIGSEDGSGDMDVDGGAGGYSLPAVYEEIEQILISPRAQEFLEAFQDYSRSLGAYLVTLENRLFSEGLHVIGEPPSAASVLSYLDALYAAPPQAQAQAGGHDIDTGIGARAGAGAGAGTAAVASVAASTSLGQQSGTAATSVKSAADSGAATEANNLEKRARLAPQTLHTIATGAVHALQRSPSSSSSSFSSSSSLVFRALEAQKAAETDHTNLGKDGYRSGSRRTGAGAQRGVEGLLRLDDRSFAAWDANKMQASASGYGVDWFASLTDEDKFAWRLLRSGDFSSFVALQNLQWRRAWGDGGTDERIQDLILAQSAVSSRARAGAGVGGRNQDIKEAVELARLLARNPHVELSSFINAIGGSYVAPAPGGDLIRDGASVLPTGSNIHSLDPYRIPSNTALRRGQIAAEKIIAAHRRQNNGAFPETVAVTLWGLDVIKTKGESIGIVLGLVGAVPVREATGRIVSFDLLPIKQVGRPRVDVVASLSGIFRDTFANVLELLDELFEKAAQEELNEEDKMYLQGLVPGQSEFNYIRQHTSTMSASGIDRPSSRLFSQPPGDFGSMVNEQVGSGEWQDGTELGDQWESRNSYSYGSGKESTGEARPEVLKSLLSTTERVVQEVDSVEYGLTDIQEYYANTGGLKKAAENNSKKGPGTKVGISIIEAFQEDVEPMELEETLRMEYRTKLLNPAWADAMRRQGSGGAYEVSTRMTALIGWGGTCDFTDDFVFDGAAQTYALDEDMAEHLKNVNPEAFRNIIKRMLEATGRGMWSPSEEVLQKLQELYDEAEDEVEGVN